MTKVTNPVSVGALTRLTGTMLESGLGDPFLDGLELQIRRAGPNEWIPGLGWRRRPSPPVRTARSPSDPQTKRTYLGDLTAPS